MSRVVDAAAIVMAALGGWGVASRAHGSVVPRAAQPATPESPAPGQPRGGGGSEAPPAAPVELERAQVQVDEDKDMPSVSCLANTICAVKDRVRWRTSPWSISYCERIARDVLEAAKREHLPPALIVAVMINESTLDSYAVRTTMKGNTVYAKDGGLMGVRCILDRQGRCANGQLRGLTWTDVIKPEVNIGLGAAALAHWRDVGGVAPVKTRVRQPSGEIATKVRLRRCPHLDHAYWAHYNHGVRYIDHGPARHYPHRIAVLYYALSQAMSLDTRALKSMHLSVSDTGRRVRTADRPVEARDRALCHSIASIGPVCGGTMTARNELAAP